MKDYSRIVLHIIGIRNYRSFRLALRGVALLVGLVCGFYVSVLLEQGRFACAAAWFSIVCAAALIEFVFADILADREFPFDTERKIALMEKRVGAMTLKTVARRLSEVISDFKGCNTSKISATVHILTEVSSTADRRSRVGLLQLTKYVGPQGGGKGRVTHVSQGIIGRCARTGAIETADFCDADEYEVAMVRDFGFTDKEAGSHTKSARSYLAVPLKTENGATVGVLYFFTTEPQVFPVAASVKSLMDCATEITRYLSLAEMVSIDI